MSRYVLGLETGIDGGSLSIFQNGMTVDSASGSGNVSKSEDLLSMLDGLLEKNSLDKLDLGSIVISDEPGSLTGVRIGLATAKGLSDALSVPVRKISVLKAMASIHASPGRILSAIMTQKNAIYFREYLLNEEREIRSSEEPAGKAEPKEFAAVVKSLCLESESESEKAQFVFNERLLDEMVLNKEIWTLTQENRLYISKGLPAEFLARSSK